jgi:hypothetical protein
MEVVGGGYSTGDGWTGRVIGWLIPGIGCAFEKAQRKMAWQTKNNWRF